MKISAVSNLNYQPVKRLENPYQRSVNFKGHLGSQIFDGNGIGKLINETAFFRDFQTKLFAVKYINKNFGNKNKINIVVGGCSTGEEAITLSMLLANLKNRVSILGIDLSGKAIRQAKSRQYIMQTTDEPPMFVDDYAAFKDSFLAFNTKQKLTRTEHFEKNLFEDYFELCPNVGISFFKRLKDTLGFSKLETPSLIKDYKTFKLKDDKAKNCKFKVGDINDLDNIIKGEKSDVIFLSNTLYHILTIKTNRQERFMSADAKAIFTRLAKTFKDNLNPKGIVCFGEHEEEQMPNNELVYKVMLNLGFEPLNKTSEHGVNVYKKWF